MSEVSLSNINKHYGDLQVLFDVSLKVKEGHFVVFVGPSGCGKSTLLRAIAGLEDITEGEIYIGGKLVNEVPPADREVAMVFQSYALYPHMSVQANMEFGLKVNKIPVAEREKRIQETARILQLDDYLSRKPGQLSGGQRQRVAIGRAIVKQPKVFLFDEPLSNLDAALRVQMRVELENLHNNLGSTMIYVTHDQVEAMTLADEIVVLKDGRIEQIGQPLELYHHPKTRFVAEFIGSPKMNFLNVISKGQKGDELELAFQESAINCPGFADLAASQEGTKLLFGIRPEHIEVCQSGSGILDAEVMVVESLGNETNIYANLPGDEQIVVRSQRQISAKKGELIGLKMMLENAHLFDSQSLALPRSI